MERRRLQALINSAASRSASILLVEEDLEDIPQLNPPAALAFVAPERWEAEGAGSDQRLTIAVAGSRLSLSPLERCLLPFAEYTITVHCDNEAWSVRRRFSAFVQLLADLGETRWEPELLAALPPLRRTLLGCASSLNPAFRRARAAALQHFLHALAAVRPSPLRAPPLADFLGVTLFHPARRPRLLREPRWGDGEEATPPVRRILCLHGRRSNAAAMRAQSERVRAALPAYEFVFLEAPMRAPAAADVAVSGLADPPYFEWWAEPSADAAAAAAAASAGGSAGGVDAAAAAEAEAALLRLEGLHRSAVAVASLAQARGPFCAALGIGEGATVAAVLTALQRGFAPPRPFGLPELPCLWDAVVLGGGAAPVRTNHAATAPPSLRMTPRPRPPRPHRPTSASSRSSSRRCRARRSTSSPATTPPPRRRAKRSPATSPAAAAASSTPTPSPAASRSTRAPTAHAASAAPTTHTGNSPRGSLSSSARARGGAPADSADT